MKEIISAAAGAIGAVLAKIFGGFDSALTTLMVFMAADYISGLILAGVFKKSPKSKNGALESHAGFKGLMRKGITLIIVLLSYRLDSFTGQSFIADGVIIAFITNEAISITENAALIGIPMPAPLIKAIDILKSDSTK
ncbi:MAG: phage holin family protein [Clostridia bacterium]|nr:phage holin family protein [Clostridia bacterium]